MRLRYRLIRALGAIAAIGATVCTGSGVVRAQEFAAPNDLTTGRLLRNEQFQEWRDGKPANWVAAVPVQQSAEEYQGAKYLEIVPNRAVGYVYQRFSGDLFRSGDTLAFEMEAKSGQVDALAAVIWVVYSGQPPLKAEFRTACPVGAQWHKLLVKATVADAKVERVDFLAVVGDKATEKILVRSMKAWLIPAP